MVELKGEPSWSPLAMCQVVRYRERCMEKTSGDQVLEVLEPAEQQTILFYDKPLIVVRLPNGEPGAVLRYFCDNLGLAQNRQIDRIKRKKALAAGLHYARIETAGGPQVLAVLTHRSLDP
jgi:hypothetical protein